jgi:hypothetical protein
MLRLSENNDQAAAGEILSLFFLSIKCCIFVIMTTLNRSEQIIYNRLAKSVEEIKLYKEGKIQLQDAADFLNEL